MGRPNLQNTETLCGHSSRFCGDLCESCYNKKYREEHVEELRESKSIYGKTFRLRDRARQFSMTVEQLEERLLSQDSCCAICRLPITLKTSCIDHDWACCPGKRSCGKCVRGILCSHCNIGLGNFRDSQVIMFRAINYLGVDSID